MDQYRFFVPDLIARQRGGQGDGVAGAGGGGQDQIALPEDQAHHARTVLRLQPGDRVVIFDGQGAWAEGTLIGDAGPKARRAELHVELEGGIHVDPPPARTLTIATAVPKGERAEWLIEQTSQLNTTRIQWIDCDRSVVKLRDGGGGGGGNMGGGQKIDKWRRLAIEAAKQCGRTHVMQVTEPANVKTVLDQSLATSAKILWLEPRTGPDSKTITDALHACAAAEIVALVGPEGGWSEREHAFLEQAASQGTLIRVRLTPTVLRIETACAAIAAIIMSAV